MSDNQTVAAYPAITGYRETSANLPATRSVQQCTVKDVARLAGVSQATVSRVVNGADQVSSETRRRVLIAVSKLQFRPNVHAAELGRAKGGLARKRA